MAGGGARCHEKEEKEEKKEDRGLPLSPVRSLVRIWGKHKEDVGGFNEKIWEKEEEEIGARRGRLWRKKKGFYRAFPRIRIYPRRPSPNRARGGRELPDFFFFQVGLVGLILVGLYKLGLGIRLIQRQVCICRPCMLYSPVQRYIYAQPLDQVTALGLAKHSSFSPLGPRWNNNGSSTYHDYLS